MVCRRRRDDARGQRRIHRRGDRQRRLQVARRCGDPFGGRFHLPDDGRSVGQHLHPRQGLFRGGPERRRGHRGRGQNPFEMGAGGFGVDSRRSRRDLRAGCRRHDHLDAPHPLRRQHGRCGALRHADPRADRRSGLQHRICRLSIRSGYAVRHRRQARSRGRRRGEIRCGGSRRGGRRRDLPDVGHLRVRAGRGAGDLHFLRCGEPQRYEDRARGSDRVLDQGHRGADRSACHQAGVLSRGRHRFGRRPEDVRRGVQRRGRHFRLDVGRRRQDRRGAGRRRHEGCRVDGRRYGRASVRRRRCRQRAPDPELEHGAAALRPHGRGFGDP